MDTTNKNAILDALKTASGVIDKLAIIKTDGNIYDITDLTWSAASGGYLALSAAVNFENTNVDESDNNVIGVALLSSITTPTAGQPASTESVALSYFGTTVQVQYGETLRIESATYTID